MTAGRPRETKRVYIHTSLSHPVYDRMVAMLEKEGKVPPGAMRDFVEECIEAFFIDEDASVAVAKAIMDVEG